MAFLYGWQQDSVFLFLLYLGMIVTLQGIVMSWMGPKSAKVVRSWNPHIPMAGQDIVVSFQVTVHGGIFPLWLELEDFPNGTAINGQSCSPLKPEGKLRWSGLRRRYLGQYVIKQAQRGIYEGGYVVLRWGDVFGWFTRKLTVSINDICVVQPAMVGIESVHYSGIGSEQSTIRIKAMTATHAIAQDTVRDYESGDPIKNIHWKSSAKRGALLTRQSELTPYCEKLIWLNSDKGAYVSHTGDKHSYSNEECFEYFVAVATAWIRREVAVRHNLVHYLDSSMGQPCLIHHPADLQEVLMKLAGITMQRQEGTATQHHLISTLKGLKNWHITMVTGHVTKRVVDQLLPYATSGYKVEVWCAHDGYDEAKASEIQYRACLEQAGVVITPLQVIDLMSPSLQAGGAQDASA